MENIKPYFIRIKKSDLNLPAVEEHTWFLSQWIEDHRDIYDFIERKACRFFQEESSPKSLKYVLKSKLIRLRQAATNPSLLLKSLRDAP